MENILIFIHVFDQRIQILKNPCTLSGSAFKMLFPDTGKVHFLGTSKDVIGRLPQN